MVSLPICRNDACQKVSIVPICTYRVRQGLDLMARYDVRQREAAADTELRRSFPQWASKGSCAATMPLVAKIFVYLITLHNFPTNKD